MKNLILSSVFALIASSAAKAQEAVQWRVQDGGNGHWYRLVLSGPITWTNARAASEQIGGHLVTPTSAAENAFLLTIASRGSNPLAWVDDFGGNSGGPWIGGYQPANASLSQPWAWVSGEPWSWTGWAPGEPNGGFGPGVSVTALLGYAGSNTIRGWSDAGLSDFPPYPLPPSYVVEWSADCNGDGIVDYGQVLQGQLVDADASGVPDSCEIDPTRQAVQWRLEDGGNGHWYQGILTSSAGASWTAARATAISRGADLACVRNAIEANWLFATIVQAPSLWSGSAGPWVGGLQAQGSVEPAGGWVWVDGTSVNPTIWSVGQPDNATDCGGDNNRIGYWNAQQGSPRPYLGDSPDSALLECPPSLLGRRIAAVIEWSADCNSDGIVDYGQILDGTFPDANANGVPDCCDGGESCTPCPGDVVRDELVDGVDLAAVLSQWGTQGSGAFNADIDGSGLVDGGDLALILGGWGPCPQ